MAGFLSGEPMSKDHLDSLQNLMRFQAKLKDDYFIAFGRFIEQFSTAEIALFFLLSRSAKVSIPIARAVFSGVRAEQGIKFIKRIWQVDKTPMLIRSELTKVFTQFIAINEVRNTIVHHGTREAPFQILGERVTSDGVTALVKSRIRVHTISVAKLDAMTQDMRKITHHVISLYTSPRTEIQKRAKTYPDLLDAWQYKPQPARQQSQRKRKKKGRKKG